MIGLYVDDGVAGVGTLTFYREKTKEFGALGHLITESRSQERVNIRQGTIVEANISGINSGQKGLPGEKLGTFFQTTNVLGKVIKNNRFGIYGDLIRNPEVENKYFTKPLPIATSSHVKKGPAKIYTVINGGEIEEFNIQIERVYRQSNPSGKGMIIYITDPDLKRMTGGIVQGMSGSPIVQNEKLIGAITHVFVNDPCRGYGVFAEWMVLQTDYYKKAS
jgi:stage IV sporulation protein B